MRVIEVRPRADDLVGRAFPLAGFGRGSEATVLWRVLADHGAPLAEVVVPGAGSDGVIDVLEADRDVLTDRTGSSPARSSAFRCRETEEHP